MGMMGPPREAHEPILEINTTPLIDVLLVLLIMLIVTIPAPLHAVHTALPAPSASPALSPVPPVRLEVGADGEVRWNGQTVVGPQALQERLAQLVAQAPQPAVHIRAHDRARYGAVAAVLAAAQRAGVAQLGVAGGG